MTAVGTIITVVGTIITIVGTIISIVGTIIPVVGTIIPIVGTIIPVVGTSITIVGTIITAVGTIIPIVGTIIPITGTSCHRLVSTLRTGMVCFIDQTWRRHTRPPPNLPTKRRPLASAIAWPPGRRRRTDRRHLPPR
jgi:hypothetical protein